MRGAVLAMLMVMAAGAAPAQSLPPVSGQPGDAARGLEILRDGSKATCLICHSISALPDRDQGQIAPPLDAVGAAYSEGELRQRIADARVLNPDTIMPPYFSQEGLTRVGQRWQGTTIYTAQELDDVVAYLLTLRG